MIDFTVRRAAAELLRQFVAGRMTNDELETRWPTSGDPAVREIRDAAWMLCSDLREYRLTGADRLPTESRRAVARWIVFLHGERPYEWPVTPAALRFAQSVVNVLTLGLTVRLWDWRLPTRGDLDVWPFIRRTDLRRALRRPRLLSAG
jgi:hypothetical protein